MRILAQYALDEAARQRLERISSAVMECFSAGGYARIVLPVLQPADLYLDMAGEDIRERMFVFEDPLGNELCLRADLTIPLCRSVIDAAGNLPTRLSCAGPVFRFEGGDEDEPTELLQAGIECLGVTDSLAADAEVLSLARAALDRANSAPVVVELGDVSLFGALLAELKIDDIWARKLNDAFRHPALLRPTLDDLRAGKRPRARAFDLDFAAANKAAAERFVRDKLGIATGETAGGRTIAEIAAHLIDKANAARALLPDARQLDLIETFLGVQGDANACLAKLKALGLGGAFARGLARLEECVARARSSVRGGDALELSTMLGRNFVYYTGFVFNLKAPGIADPLAAGGRYDRLMSDLGSARPVPAAGCAVWPERVLAGARI